MNRDADLSQVPKRCTPRILSLAVSVVDRPHEPSCFTIRQVTVYIIDQGGEVLTLRDVDRPSWITSPAISRAAVCARVSRVRRTTILARRGIDEHVVERPTVRDTFALKSSRK